MQHYTYLLINFFTIIICFIFSFHPKIKFNNYFIPFLKASILVAIPFILWDIWFTKKGVWWFNYNYTLGFKVGNLPLEEVLFFFCIPFSCVFTYYCINKFFNLTIINSFNNIIVFITTIICTVFAFLHPDKTYTFVTAVVTLITVIYFHFIAKVEWIGQASLLFTILMLGFFPVNGVLTGSFIDNPIVNYNPQEFLNFRLGTIPIEDAVYGYTQFLWVIYFFKKFSKISF